jgi:hypothetical protein
MVLRSAPESLLAGQEISVFTVFRPVLVPSQPPVQWESWIVSLAVGRPGRVAGHLPLFSV